MRFLKIQLTCLWSVLLILIGTAFVLSHKDRLELVSPNGEYKISMQAFDNAAGIWITHGKGMGNPQVAIYNMEGQGAVLGAYAAHPKDDIRALDIAISANEFANPIQYVTQDGKVKHFEPD